MKHLFTVLLTLAAGILSAGDDRLLISQGQKLERDRNIAGALEFYKESLKKDLNPATRRTFLNRCALFERDREKRQAFLDQALMVLGANPTEHYRTFLQLGYLYRRTAPDRALGFFLNFENEEKISPSLICRGCFEAGRIMEAKNDKTKALELYRKALTAGKSVPWRFDCSAQEEAVLRLEKELEKSK